MPSVNKFFVMEYERDSQTGAMIKSLPKAVLDTREQAVAAIGRLALERLDGGFASCSALFLAEMPVEVP